MPVLKIVVSGRCFGCEEAVRLYDEVKQHFPRLAVELIDIEVNGLMKPSAVIAVPSFLLNETIIFVGNPSRDELFQKLVSLAVAGTD